ncbi:Dam family site-specific DNA-(adenine-N6)-methyltransferase [Bacteroidetes/Chlorobi group bacterium ChocPot_Mid]|jgi:DNA adenine methylase|nr:MAG: Dam family site-specific DNA-(adenine-N6)-methyltransferase [Bacteroidetes/Chlorobi group bacterium ChocPot_Mid]
MKIFVPPIKCQGIKTKLVQWIKENLTELKFDTWIEPFMGSGVVGFNVRPHKAVFADINPHLINFYNSIKNGSITSGIARNFLESEGEKLAKGGQKYYNEVRLRFNNSFHSLDFLFLNRSCFNGMIRFNKNGKFNVPFGHKPNRFSKAYITKITNQIDYIHQALNIFDWTFVCQNFDITIKNANKHDIIYCDPPYLGRHVDYFDSWDVQNEKDLYDYLSNFKGKYILSTWHSNRFRTNEEINKYNKNNILTKEHFYYVGASEKNRNTITEALILNYSPLPNKNIIYPKITANQYRLFEPKVKYLKKEN